MNLVDLLSRRYPKDGEQIRNLHRFNVTNIAEYYYSHDKEYWYLTDFPMPRPPYDNMWAEYKVPKVAFSKEQGMTDFSVPGYAAYYGAFIHPGPHPLTWSIVGRYCYAPTSGREKDMVTKMSPTEGILMELGEDGNILAVSYSEDMIRGRTDEQLATAIYSLHPILMAFSFSNCRNIEVVTVKAPERLQRARKKRNKFPLADYRVINILPFGKVFKATSRVVISEGKVDVEVRRGSYARYGPKFDRGLLFGKYEGMFWRHGKTLSGATVDYNVKAERRGSK